MFMQVHSCGWWQLVGSTVDSWEKFSSVTTGDGLSAQQQIFGEAPYDWSIMSSTPYSCPVTSSIVGPAGDRPQSSPLSTTLLMEVVRVCIKIDLVVSSLMTLLELMLEIPEVVSILTDIMSMDVSPPCLCGFWHLQASYLSCKALRQTGQL